MLNFFRAKPKSVKVPESSHQSLIDRIKNIRVDASMRVFSPDLANLTIRVSYRTIQEYNQFLKLILLEMDNPKGIKASFFQNVPLVIPIKDWYIGINGFYLDTQTETQVFQERAIAFVDKYIEIENKLTDELQRSFGGLNIIINQIKEITSQLLLITQGVEVVQKPKSAIKREGL